MSEHGESKVFPEDLRKQALALTLQETLNHDFLVRASAIALPYGGKEFTDGEISKIKKAIQKLFSENWEEKTIADLFNLRKKNGEFKKNHQNTQATYLIDSFLEMLTGETFSRYGEEGLTEKSSILLVGLEEFHGRKAEVH